MIFVVGGIKGGVGKSTIADNLAVLSARDGRDVLLVDGDDQATTMTWAAVRGETAGVTPITTIALSGNQARAELERLGNRFEVIIVDAGARDTTTQRAALSVADVVVLPFPARGPDLWTLDKVADTVTEVRTINRALRALVFVNKADAQGDDNAEAEAAFREHAEFEILPVRVGARKAIAAAHLVGLGVGEMPRPKRDVKAITEMEALFRCIFSIEKVSIEHGNGIGVVS